MVDAVVSLFVDKLVNVIQREGQVILDLYDEFKTMEQNLSLIRGFLKDVDKMQRKNDTIYAIAKELRELIYDAEDILMACISSGFNETKPVMDSFFKGPSSMKIISRHEMGKRLKIINKNIKEIEGKMSVYLTPALSIHNREEEASNDRNWSTPIFDENQVVGLESSVNKIKNWMFQASEKLTIMGFVGMGGLGKTTLAQKVFNDKEVDRHFEKTMWVSVSRPVQEEKIMRSILRYLGDVGLHDDKDEMLKKIKAYLAGKSYLLVLDDVWQLTGDWWGRLKGALPTEKNNCVVMTTRDGDIARRMGVTEERIHRPSLLTDEDSWTLFSSIAFVGRLNMIQDPVFNEIGKDMVRKCAGLPLAIKAVGGLMASTSTSIVEWKRIAKNFNEELAQNEDLYHKVMTSLQLSYDELPAYLKPCLLCFSIYPEDCVVLGSQLVRWWIGEGFVPMENGTVSVLSAEYCFMGLVNRCLVEIVDKSNDGKVYTCKMHDLVRDLVIKIGEREAFFKNSDPQSRRWPIHDVSGKINPHETRLRAIVSVTNCRYIDTLESSFIGKISGCQNLRVLDISESISDAHFNSMLSKIGSLRHLRYLNLRNTHPLLELPISISNLRNLLVLDLSFCQNLATIPSCLINMTELVVLDLHCCGSLKYLPKGLGKLSHLQVLKGFKPSRSCFLDGCHMEELRSLTQLMELEMVVTRPDEIADDEIHVLEFLSRLRSLTLSFVHGHGMYLVQKLEQLSLPEGLNDLTLKYYPGNVAPKWLNPNSLPELQYLSICSGNIARFDQRFYGDEKAKWKVIGLVLELLPDLDETWQGLQASMPYLRKLNVSWCPRLDTFPIENVELEGDVWTLS